MKKFNFHYYPRDFEAGNFIENFLVSAVSSILVIRLFLVFFKYPQVGGQSYHIAHMLIGGFIMMFTLIALLVFLNRETKIIASITGGIGFGAFIDELGKFITKDNNYFYQPTIALIYVILVVIFLAARVVEKYFRLTEAEYAINAMELSKNVILHNLDTEEKHKAIYLLKQTNTGDLLSRALLKALREIRAKSVGEPNIFHKIRNFFREKYLSLIKHPLFTKIIVGFFIITFSVNFFSSLFNFKNADSFNEWGQIIFSFVSGALVIIGVQLLIYKSSRKYAYEMFKYAILISIFLTQYFRFLQEQLTAIFGLILTLITLSVVQYLIYEESLISKD